ncbi:MAG: hypothetical protein ACOYXT_15345 [Bacteroidota bacterium]
MNITAIKTSTLQSLKRQANDATTIAAKAQAAYDSFSNKAQFFKDLYTQTTNDLGVITGQWTQFLSLKSSLSSLEDTSDDCNEVSQVTYEKIKLLVRKWDEVVHQALEAADAINLASDYINKRKASNALISADLVTDATQAANNATAVVTLVINSLTAALNTLTVASQSTNSSNLTGVYIDLASAALIAPKVNAKTPASQPAHIPLEVSLGKQLQNAKQRQTAAQAALNDANEEMANAKEQLDTANAKVVAAQAALTAAQAAVSA